MNQKMKVFWIYLALALQLGLIISAQDQTPELAQEIKDFMN